MIADMGLILIIWGHEPRLDRKLVMGYKKDCSIWEEIGAGIWLRAVGLGSFSPKLEAQGRFFPILRRLPCACARAAAGGEIGGSCSMIQCGVE